MTRPNTYTVAALLQFAISVTAVVLGVWDLKPGSSIEPEIPYPVLLFAFAAGVLGILSAYGVWKMMRWGVILTIVLRALDGLAAAPGLLFAPTAELKAMATIFVVVSIVIIALLLWPRPRVSTAS
jgi:hypothetical protein